MFECARMTEYPVISLGDLQTHYNESTYDMHQLIEQATRVDAKTSSVWDVILTSHPT